MNTRQNRLVLWTIAGILGASSLLTLAGAVLLPYDSPQTAAPAPVRPTTLPSPAAVPPLDAFVQFWDRPLRGPLVDTPQVADATPATTPGSSMAQGSALRLLGTIIEPGHAYALLQMPGGQLEFKGVGADIDGAEVLEIGEGTVTIRSAGRVDTLTVPAPQP